MTGVGEAALIAAAVAGTAVSAGAAIHAGQARKKQAEYQATVAQQQAQHERAQARASSEQFLRRQRRMLATARAARAGSGVSATGSPLLVDEDTISEIALQTEQIRRGGEVRGTRLDQEAGLLQARGSAAQTAGFLQAGSSLLTGASQFDFGGGGGGGAVEAGTGRRSRG